MKNLNTFEQMFESDGQESQAAKNWAALGTKDKAKLIKAALSPDVKPEMSYEEIPAESKEQLDQILNAPIVKFKRWMCLLDSSGKYNNGRTAIELTDVTNGEPVLVATVNIAEEPLAKDEIIIKNWSENEGILEVLQKAGIVGQVIRKVPTGFVEADVVKLLKK